LVVMERCSEVDLVMGVTYQCSNITAISHRSNVDVLDDRHWQTVINDQDDDDDADDDDANDDE